MNGLNSLFHKVCILGAGAVLFSSSLLSAAVVQLESGAIDYYEPPVMPECPDGREAEVLRRAETSEQEIPPVVPPVSMHQAELEYHLQFDAETESEWDAVQAVQRAELPVRKTAPLKGGASSPGPFTLQKEVFGWHPYWEGTSYTNFTFDLLSTVAYFSYVVDPNTGYATTMNSWSNTPLVEWAHSNNTEAVLCATLFSGHSTFFGSAAAQSNLINELIRVVNLRNADGVNIDFEGVPSGSRSQLTAFMSNLTVKMHAQVPGSQVSICLPAVDWSSNFDVAAFDGFLDKCIMMGYDYSWSKDTQAGPVAPLQTSAVFGSLSVGKSVSNYLAAGLSPGKLLLGVPYYGYDWPTVSYALHANTITSGVSRSYPAAKSFAETYGYNWDTNSLTPYVLYGSYRQLWYDDTNSLARKYDFANSKNLAGIGIWALNKDAGVSDLWDLLAEKFSSSDAQWVTQNSGTSTNFYGVGAKASSFAAVGAAGAIYTSPDSGETWVSRVSGTTSMLLNFISGGSYWVAVGDAGTIVTSVGGATWTVRTTPTNAMLRGAAYGNGVFVAAGANGTILRSTNASNWTQQVSGTSENIQGVNYAGGLFIATGENSLLLTSSDGISWTSRTSNAAGWLLDASYGNGTYVAVGLGSRIVTSPDGTMWTRQTNNLPSGSVNLYRVAFGNGQFVAVGQNGVIWGSTNGINWFEENSGTTNFLRGVVYSNDLFVVSGYNGTILTKGAGAPSVDIGTTGTTVPNSTSSQTITGTANAYVVGTMRWTNSLGGGGTFAAGANWSFSASLAVGTNLITVAGTNSAGSSASDSVTFVRETAGGGEEPAGDELVVTPAPSGALTNIVVFTSAGHGYYANTTSGGWYTGRGLINGVVEDMGNIDQLNTFVQYCLNAGAAVIPCRPVGYQTNEVVLDNDDAGVTYSGSWSDSSSTIYYGSPGDTPYRFSYITTTGQSAVARYTPTILVSGEYPVYTWALYSGNRVRQLYRIRHSGGINEIKVNHRRVGAGWVWLGNYYFEAGTNGYVEISNYAPGYLPGTDVVIADAIRFGNGMGNINRGWGVSGYEKELEASRYWVQNMTGQGMSSDLYDRPTLDDNDDNVGAPPRIANYMDNEADGDFWDRIYLGFHSNADTNVVGIRRGAMGLYSTANSSACQLRQQAFASALNSEIETDFEFLDNGVGFIDDWTDNSSDVYGASYGEISETYNPNMNHTIIEVAFHNNPEDAKLLKDPSARRYFSRSCYKGLVKHLNANNATVPLNFLPDPPVAPAAVNVSGGVRISWSAPATNIASGQAATGYRVYRSENGYGFGSPVATTNLNVTLTNLNSGAVYFFRVTALNAGGESLPSETIGSRASPAGRAQHLIVNGFDRFDRALSPTQYFGGGISGYVTMVRPRQINSFDYVVQHGQAIAAAGQYFDSASHQAIISSAVRMTNYHAAYWILGEESTADETFSSTEQSLVQSFLTDGGNLFVSGAELGWDLGRTNGVDMTFFTNVLKTAYVSDDAATDKATGRTGSIFSGISALTFSETAGPGDTIYGAEYPDVFQGRGGATTALVYGTLSSGTSAAAIQYSNNYRLVVMGFPFETILDLSARTNIMKRTLTYFGDAPEDAPALEVTSGNSTVTFAIASASISGTNNAAVVGTLTWTNSLTGGTGTHPAASAWTISGIALDVGANVITVRGTNLFGASSSDSVTITREADSGGAGVTLIDEPFDEAPTAPAGWTFNGIAGTYTTSGNYGRNPPSVKLDDTGDWMLTPSFMNGSNLTFWIKGQGTDSSSYLLVEVYSGGSWSTLDTVVPLPTTGTTKSYLLAANVTRLRFTYDKTAGNLSFDDVIVTGVETEPDADTDGDGIPDWWEVEHFGSVTGATHTADSDGDGADNWSEWIALTEPTNINSMFWLEAAPAAAGGKNVVSWPSASGRTYSLYWNVNLTSAFGTVASGIEATPPLNVHTDALHGTEGRIYYRVKALK